MFLVAAVSIVLLIYVAFGEAKRTYEQFRSRNSWPRARFRTRSKPHQAGPPVQQFVGFNQLADPMVKADPLIDAISFYDLAGSASSTRARRGSRCSAPTRNRAGSARTASCSARRARCCRSPCRSPTASSRSGTVVLSVPREKVAGLVEDALHPARQGGRRVRDRLRPLRPLLHARHVGDGSLDLGRRRLRRRVPAGRDARRLDARQRLFPGRAGAGQVARRQPRPAARRPRRLNINLDEITGIIALYGDYKRLNPEIRAAALLVDGKVRAHVDPKIRNAEWDHVRDRL